MTGDFWLLAKQLGLLASFWQETYENWLMCEEGDIIININNCLQKQECAWVIQHDHKLS